MRAILPSPSRSAAGLALCLSLAAVLLTAPPGRGSLIFFKDGFVISGKVKQETKLVLAHHNETYPLKGFIFVEDPARR
jgi:hypothetical protein